VSGVPAQAAFPGKNGALAFTNDRDGQPEVFRIRADGSGERRLSDTAGVANGDPQWSADGQKIVFTNHPAYKGIDSEIYAMDSDGSDEVNLTDDTAWDREPSWFPGGRRIAYSSDRTTDGSGQKDIYTLNLDPSGAAEPVRITNTPNVDESHAAVSPDGTRIAFIRRDPYDGSPDVFVMRAEPQSPTNRAKRLTRNSMIGGNPDWSPDGRRIAFPGARSVDGIYRKGDIWTIDPDGTNKTNVTKTPGVSEWQPAFSPNGEKIAFMSNRYETDEQYGDVWKMGTDGSDPVRLTDDLAYKTGLDWQPLP
jgi:TolB protein